MQEPGAAGSASVNGTPGSGPRHAGAGRWRRSAFKPVYLLYYRLLYGRSFLGAAALERRVRDWERVTGRGDAPAERAVWDEQYRSGHWELMRGADELARYATIAAWLHRLHPGGSVLDVGSGEGILLEHLRPLGGGRYLGVDISGVAVERGRARRHRDAEFVAADAERWLPETSFDALVFNECVYYFEQPVLTVQRYLDRLSPGGTVVLSIFRTRRADVIRRRLAAVLPPLDQLTLASRKGAWVLSLHRPGQRTGTAIGRVSPAG